MGIGLLERSARFGAGAGPWAALIWLPLLAIGTLADVPADIPGWSLWVGVLTACALHIGAVTAVHGPRAVLGDQPDLLLGLQAVVTIGPAMAYGRTWMPMLHLLAIAVGAAARPRVAPAAVVAVTVASVTVVAVDGGTWGDLWTTALAVFLCGFVTFLYYRLMAAIRELERTREDLAQAAVDRERERFARDLHDLLGHTMSLIVVKAEAVRRLVERDPAAAQAHAHDIERIGREALVEVRRAVAGYRGTTLQDELVRAELTLTSAGLAAHVGPAPDLPEDVDAVLGWVVREGVTNVVRHARATTCRVETRVVDGRVRLTIEDDGAGSPAPDRGADAIAGSGVAGLRTRVIAAGGWLDAGPGPAGFRLVADVPVPSLVGRL